LSKKAENIDCKEHFKLAKVGFTDDFWARGFYCGTARHVSAEQVARYIAENR